MSLVRHSTYNVVGLLLPTLLTLVTVPIYIRLIGVERYGLLALCWTLLAFASFAGLGIGPSVNRLVAARCSETPVRRAQVFWTGFKLALLAAFVASPLLAIGSLFYIKELNLTPEIRAELLDGIPWIACIFAVSLISAIPTGALQGSQRFGMLNLITLLSSALLVVLPLTVAVVTGPRLDHLIAGTLVANLIGCGCLFWASRTAVPFGRPLPIDRSLFRPMLSYGSWVTATTMLAPVVMLIDRFLIGNMVGLEAVGAYVIAYTLVSRLTMVAASVHGASLPRFVAAFGEEERSLADVTLRALLSLLVPGIVLVAALATPFFHLWLGSTLASQAAPVALLLLPGIFAHSIGHVPSTVLMGRGRPDIISKLLLLYTLPYFALLYVFVERFGIAGAAVAWSVRATFDFSLFFVDRPQVRRVAATSLGYGLIVAASAVGLLLPFDGGLYWFSSILLFSCATLLAYRLSGSDLLSQLQLWRSRRLDRKEAI